MLCNEKTRIHDRGVYDCYGHTEHHVPDEQTVFFK